MAETKLPNETAFAQLMEAIKSVRSLVPLVTDRDNARQVDSLLRMVRNENARHHGFKDVSTHKPSNSR